MRLSPPNKCVSTYIARMAIAIVPFVAGTAKADLLDLIDEYSNELERNAAIANQKAYDDLKAAGCTDSQRGATDTCGGANFVVWQNVRELVHTANDLMGNDPNGNSFNSTEFSLGLDTEGLGFALRWTAGEEFSTEGSMTDSFASGQLSGLSSRITALRQGAKGFFLSGLPVNGVYSGMNAGDAPAEDAWSRLGGFINGSFTYGSQGASVREDAFDFDGSEINGGLDYRLDDHWVVGALFGYQKQSIDFDSRLSIVDGGVEMTGYSILPFALYQSDKWFASGSIGYQSASFDTTRSIRYPSLNPDTENVDTKALSSNDAQVFILNSSLGYTFSITPNFVIEPSVEVNFQDVAIDAYAEEDINNKGFNFLVDAQKIQSLETVFGLRSQYTFSNSYGVFAPFVQASFYGQQKDGGQTINAAYGEVNQVLNEASQFSLPTNNPEKDYRIYTLGISAVVRGASQKSLGAAANGGIQVYLSYRTVENIGNYTQTIIAGGVRYEF